MYSPGRNTPFHVIIHLPVQSVSTGAWPWFACSRQPHCVQNLTSRSENIPFTDFSPYDFQLICFRLLQSFRYFYQKFVLFYRTGPKKILSVQQSSPAQSCRSLYGEGNERQLCAGDCFSDNFSNFTLILTSIMFYLR